MPLTPKGEEILANFVKEYGQERGKAAFYASRNAGTITGVDSEDIAVAAASQIEPPVARAAGILFATAEDKILLMRRTGHDQVGTWALPGGGMEEGESAEETARRETLEEAGYEHEGKLIAWTRRVLNGVDFTTFVAMVDETFEPTLNDEHDAFMWVDRAFAVAAVSVLHPGLIIALARFDMDELSIAKAIRAGELASPQRYGNLMLVAMRITGTGAAYRRGLDEFVWRDPSLYLNPEFLERCMGLPVILMHPEDSTLNTEEFRKRIVGTIMMAYTLGDEVWGIAKILDMDVAQMIEEERMSTSPAVVVRSAEPGVNMTLGKSKLLIEGKPILLDHLAICPHGVWDKGGEPSGIDSITVESSPDVRLDAALSLLRDSAINAAVRRVGQI